MSSAGPAVHSVHFYDTDEALIHRLSAIVCSGLLNGNSVLIVATGDHRKQLADNLRLIGVDARKYEKTEQLTLCDAEKLLSKFMVKGMPDPKAFRSSIGKQLMEAKKNASHENHGLVVFGEMVAVLWEKGNKAGALALESLWNDLINERAFHLHCAYPGSVFSKDEAGILNVCESHSHVVGRITAGMAN